MAYDVDYENAIAFVMERTGIMITADEMDMLASFIGGLAAEECRGFARYLRQRKLQ